MGKFHITEIFNKNGAINRKDYFNFNITDFYVWDLNEGLYVGEEFPDTNGYPLSCIPDHMIIQIKDNIYGRNGLISVVKGDATIEEYYKLFKDISCYINNPTESFIYEYEEKIINDLYKYTLKIMKVE